MAICKVGNGCNGPTFYLATIEYLIKLLEAEVYARAKDVDISNFMQKNII